MGRPQGTTMETKPDHNGNNRLFVRSRSGRQRMARVVSAVGVYSQPRSTALRIRILTWNIHKGIGGIDRRYRPERVTEVLRHHQPDIAFLQEVDEGAARSGFDRQVELFAEALSLRHTAFHAQHKLRTGPGHYGNAILSRWPLEDPHNVDLTLRFKKRRGSLCARCRIGRGKKRRSLALFNLHLGLAGFERSWQLRKFFESSSFQRLHHRTPVIVGGDLNDLWGSLGANVLEPLGFKRAGKLVSTYPAVYPVRPLDGIFLKGDVRSVRCATSRMELAAEASDHLPLVADLDLT